MLVASIARGSDKAIGADVSIPSARARCWVTTSFGAAGAHSASNSRSLLSSSSFDGECNQAFVRNR